MRATTRCFFLFGLMLGALMPLHAQEYSINIVLTKFSWSGLDPEGGLCTAFGDFCSEDPSFLFDATVYGGSVSKPVKFCKIFENFAQDAQSGSVELRNDDFITLDLSNESINLCTDPNGLSAIGLRWNFWGYENDVGAATECLDLPDRTNEGGRDENVSLVTASLDLRDYAADQWHHGLTTTATSSVHNGRYTLEFSINYTFDPISNGVTLRTTSGGDAPQEGFCEGEEYDMWIDFNDEEAGGSNYNAQFIWEESLDGGNTWSIAFQESGFQSIRNRFRTRAVFTAPGQQTKRYRVTQRVRNTGTECLLDPNPGPYLAPIPDIAPALPAIGDIDVTLLPGCGPGDINEIRFDGVGNGYNQNTMVQLILVDDPNSVTSVADSGPPKTVSSLIGYTFMGLSADNYWLKFQTVGPNAKCFEIKSLGSLTNYPTVDVTYTKVDPACPGDLGKATFTPVGGAAPFTVTATNNDGREFILTNSPYTFNFFSPFQTYEVKIVDGNGCTKTLTNRLSFTRPTAPNFTVSEASGGQISCFGGMGTIQLANISGGTPDYSIGYKKRNTNDPVNYVKTVSGPSTTLSLPQGDYDIYVRDAENCTPAIRQVGLSGPASALTMTFTTTPASFCRDDGKIDASASGGEAPYTYLIFGEPNNTTGLFENLAGGLVEQVTVIDNRGCSIFRSVPLGRDNGISTSIVSQTPVSCVGSTDGTITVTGTTSESPVTYSLNGAPFVSSGTFTGLPAGPLEITVRDARDCDATISAEIGEPESFLWSAIREIEPVACFGGTARVLVEFIGRYTPATPLMVSVDGGSNYSPVSYETENEPELISYFTLDLAAGNYSFVLKDQNGCDAVGNPQSISISQPSQVSASLASITNVTCNGADDGKITVNLGGGTGPYQVILKTASNSLVQTQTNVMAGTFTLENVAPSTNYMVEIMDANACEVTISSINVTEPRALTLNLVNSGDDIDCSLTNGEITATADGGTSPYEYSFDNIDYSTAPILGGATTSNTVFVKDANGCVTSEMLSIPQLPFSPDPVITIVDPAIAGCQTATVQVEFQGNGFAHEWAFEDITPGNPPVDGVFDFTTTSPTESSFQLAGFPPGRYAMSVVSEGCSAGSFNFEVEELEALALEATQVVDVLCFGDASGSVALTATGGVGPYTMTQNFADPVQSNATTYTDLGAANYTYQVTDSKGCQATISETVRQNDLILFNNLDIQNALCNGDSSGVIAFDVVGGVSPYTSRWRVANGQYSSSSAPEDNVRIESLWAANYDVEVTDAVGCIRSFTFQVFEPTVLTLELFAPGDATCFGGADGAVSARSDGGTQGYLYSLDNGSFNAQSSWSTLTAGKHYITAQDANGCQQFDSVTIGQPAAIAATTLVTQTSCKGADDGLIVVQAPTGGTPPYRYRIGTGTPGANPSFAGLAPGFYNVAVLDANNCLLELTTIEITESAMPLSVSTTLLEEATCSNGGKARVNYSGGTGPYSIVWDNIATVNTDEVRDLAPGKYPVAVTDARGCTVVDSVDVTTAGVPIIVFEELERPDCDADNGFIRISVTGNDRGPFTFSINDVEQTTGLFTDLPAQLHTITVSDTAGCSSTRVFNLSPPTPPQPQLSELIAEACGQGDGQFTLTATKGRGPYTYSVDGQELEENTAMNLTAGAYQVTVRDDRNCEGALEVVVPSIESPPAEVASLPEVCGRQNGQLTMIPADIAGPFTYQWAHDSTLMESTARNLAAGSYLVTVTNARGCAAAYEGLVETVQPPRIVLDSLGQAACGLQTGSIAISIIGGGAGLNVAWSHTNSTALTQTQLPPGQYSVRVTNALACSDTASFEIIEIGIADVGVEVTPSTCGESDGAISLQTAAAGAPYTFAWSHDPLASTAEVSQLAPGNYQATISDVNGCSAIIDTSVNSSQTFSADLMVQEASCAADDGSLIVVTNDSSATLTFDWSHDPNLVGPIANGLGAGSYQVTVTDAGGCSAILDTTLVLDTTFIAQLSQVTNAQCGISNGLIELLVDSGAVVTWSHDMSLNGPVAENLPSGEYTAIVSKGNCSRTLVAIVEDEGSISITLDSVGSATCGTADGFAQISTVGDSSANINWYLVSDLSTSIANGNVLTAALGGEYVVVATASDGCTNQLQVIIPQVGELQASVNTTAPSCPGTADGEAIVIVDSTSSQLSFLWNDANQQTSARAVGLEAGTYTVVITSGSCETILEVEIIDPGETTLELQIASAITCFGASDGAINLTLPQGSQYQYTLNGEIFSDRDRLDGLGAGAYLVEALDSLGCYFQDSIILSEPAALTLSEGLVNAASCGAASGGNAEIEVSGGTGPYAIQWQDPGSQTGSLALDLAAGPVLVLVSDANACSDSIEIVIPEGSSDLGLDVQLTPPSCRDGSDGTVAIVIPSGSGSYQYTWSAPDLNGPLLDSLSAGTYIVLVEDNLTGCSGGDTIVLAESDGITIDFEVQDVSCGATNNGSITTTLSGGLPDYSLQWEDGPNDAVRESLAVGDYLLLVTDANGCQQEDTVSVGSAAPLDLDLGGETVTICQGEQHYVELPDSAGITYAWTGPSGFVSDQSAVLLPLAGLYTVEASVGGCTQADSVLILSSEVSLRSTFVLPSRVLLGDTVVALEVSWPKPDAIEWLYSQDGIQEISGGGNTRYFMFSELGRYDLTLQSTLGDCIDFITKTVEVVRDSAALAFPLDQGTRQILAADISPNPNTGIFTLTINLQDAADVLVQLNDVLGSVIERRSGNGNNQYSFDYNLTLQPGVHAVTIQSKGERKTIMFLVN